jgi:hypothetical protein
MGLEAVHKFLSAELQFLYIQSFEVFLITVYSLTADCCLRDKHWRGASNPPGVSSPYKFVNVVTDSLIAFILENF